MKQLSRFRITSQPFEIVKEPSSLLATCPIYGLLFIGVPGKVLVSRVSDLIELDATQIKKNKEISSLPCKEILLPSTPSFISVSCDGITLLVCLQKSGCPVGLLFDVRGFARQVIICVLFLQVWQHFYLFLKFRMEDGVLFKK